MDVSLPESPVCDIARGIVRRLRDGACEAFFVGGCVRDMVRGVVPEEFDIVTSAHPGRIASIFPHTVPVGARFGVMIVVEGGHNFEVATYRTDEAYIDGRHPSRVAFGTLEEDVRRRDFTVNGLVLDPETGRVLDLVEGLTDIGRRVIRAIGGPRLRFGEDRLRMLRAVRFAANLDFSIEPATLAAAREHAASVGEVSTERIREEMTKLLSRGGARRGVELLAEAGLLDVILPEVRKMIGVGQPPAFHPEGDVWEHTLRMLALLGKGGPADPRLAWGVLFHDLGKTVTRSEDERGIHFYGHVQKGEEMSGHILDRLRFSRADREGVLALIRHHMRFISVEHMRPNRLKRFLRMENFPLHLELHRLDCLASHGDLSSYDFCRRKLAELPEDVLRPARLLTGDDLVASGYPPGPLFGGILRAVEDAQLNGEIATRDEALRWLRKRWGLPPGKAAGRTETVEP